MRETVGPFIDHGVDVYSWAVRDCEVCVPLQILVEVSVYTDTFVGAPRHQGVPLPALRS
jgi:hypothetical protein